jgi:hypothetical protein
MLINKRHSKLRLDFNSAYEWFFVHLGSTNAEEFKLYYYKTLDELEAFPYHSHSLSTFHFFDQILDDDYFRYLKLGKHTSYCLFNYPKGKNYILACMSLNLNNLASSLQNRERTKEVA